ncbi:hypothetical protein P3H15_32480 [Rhodococcus sp. T2V]|uniref:hypothetical protein n=1 Tax=Rhodococcus sp. T2V TaxID=3034164 RepID=UPI0023E0BF64|nr:hypothetical protein [Rhodococcus sp. T2V]MDF3309736.1 hypothetical protein [Rhodococcus sp. T2V]
MTSFGFRLFALDIKRNGRGDPQNLKLKTEDGVVHFRDYLEATVTKRKGLAVHGTPPKASEEADDDDNDSATDVSDEATDGDEETADDDERKARRPVLCVIDVSTRGDHLIVDFLYGKRSTYTHAGFSEDEVASPVDISKMKSVRPYRAAFIFPDTGTRGILAVEDANRTCPHKALERWLKYWARYDAKEAEISRSGIEGKRKKLDWWSAKAIPVNDPKRLESILKNGTSTQLVLTKTGASNSRTPGSKALKIQMGLHEAGAIATVRDAITRWFPGGAKPSSTQAEASEDLAAILADKYANLDGEEYDDAWVDVRDERGNVKHISPSRWADIFTYPVSRAEFRPIPREFFGSVRAAIERIQKSLELDIEWSGW